MNAAARRRWMLLGALLIGGTALGVIASGTMDDNLVYFWSPSDLEENAAISTDVTVRLGGQVKEGSKVWDEDARHLEFVLTDGTTEVPVEFNGDLPEMFRETIGVVVEGQLGGDGVFQSETLLVKHSNEYQAPQEGEADPDMMTLSESLEPGT